ncbi:Aste57867_5638 [Aphanomyces stellatus]|uniref:Aste57867_5638 protein n=1 Tax=Aphanomyces stellatus TaxID=120398 RepID=A0A485KEU4_9STRA|nr:hypothetical protein As57867_005625 [Aphanomyces stellatus]VFT82684.1 Aste57867_5638 [Aphanomyces stellatus]
MMGSEPPQAPTESATPMATMYVHTITPPHEQELIGASSPGHREYTAPLHSSPKQSTVQNLAEEREKPNLWSKATLFKVLWFIADVVFSFSLLLACAVRGSGISTLYLVAWILGILYTFKSRLLAVFTLFLALCGVAGNTFSIVWYETKLSGVTLVADQNIDELFPLPGKDILSVFGFKYMETWGDFLFGAGPDVLVLISSIIHLIIVHRQLKSAAPTTDIPLTASSSLGGDHQPQDGAATASYFSREALTIIVRGSEFVVLVSLFLCALSMPGYLCAVYYLIFMYCLIVWAFLSPYISRKQLEDQASTFCYFFGPTSMKLMIVYTIPVLLFCHVYQYPIIHNSTFGRDVVKHVNIFVLPGSWDNWPGYVFYGALLFLLATASRTYPIYKQLEALPPAPPALQLHVLQTRRPSAAETIYHEPLTHTINLRQRRPPTTQPGGGSVGGDRATNFSSKTSFYSAHESVSTMEAPRLTASDLLAQESFIVRVFLEDRGVLGAVAIAIFWSVSYPSYLLSILFGLSLVCLGTYGLIIPRFLLLVLNSYAILVSVVTYTLDIPIVGDMDWIRAQKSNLQMGDSKYALIDLAIHHACFFIMCFCLRIRMRYRGLLQELREEKELEKLNAEVRISILSDASSNSDRIQHENLQTHRMSFVELAALWFKDMQCVFVSLLDTLVLFTIFVTVLSTSVNLLQTGYLLLAAFLSVFKRFRRRLWRVLLIYALVVCFLMYLWNVTCPQGVQKNTWDTVGLTCYAGPTPSSSWTILWPTLFIAQLVLIVQVVIQLLIYTRTDNGRAEREAMMAQAPQRPLYFISRLTLEIDLIFRLVGGILAYLGFLFLGFSYEVDDHGRVTVIGWLQVFLMFTLLGSHMASMVKSPRGNSTKTQFLWRVVLVYENLVLIVRYVYQFVAVEEYIKDHWSPIEPYLSLEDVGLHRYANTNGLSKLFTYLFPTALMAGITAWNLRSMKRKLPHYEILAAGRSRFMDSLIAILNEFKRMVFVNSPIVLLVFNMGVVCNNINAFNVTYLSLLVTTLFKPKWTGSWKSLFWLSSSFILLLYAFQLRSFQPDRMLLHLNNNTDHAETFELTASWVGFGRVDETMAAFEAANSSADDSDTANAGNYFHASTWAMVWEHLVVMCLCLLTRATHFWDPEKDAKPRSRKQQRLRETEGYSFGGGASTSFSEDTPFLKSLQDFVIRFASEGSVTLSMLMLLISAFIHRNIISVMYLLVVRWIMVTNPITVCRNWTYLAIMLLFVCVTQYFIMLWVPPFLHWRRNSLAPWTWVSPVYQEYLALNYQHPWGLFCDYCCMLFVFMIPGAKHYYLELEKRAMAADAEEKAVLADVTHAPAPKSTVIPGDVHDFTTDTPENQTLWRVLVFVSMNYWVFCLLVMVFVSGCVRSGVASGIYLAFAIYMLVHVKYVDAPKSRMLRRLREFSWGFMFLLVLFQIPIFSDKTNTCDVGTKSQTDGVCLSVPAFLDLSKFQKNYPGAPRLDSQLPILSIVIFWMINIQELIYQSPLYDYVRAYTAREEEQSHVRRQRIYEEVLMDRLTRWTALKQDKQAAILRLKSIISRMVNKVEEMMDIASGLNYSLPPGAPQAPIVIVEETTQNTATITWTPPESTLHRIRSYTVTRQVYPPTTLLGDYTDPIEVKASAECRLVIDGLRPGTSYQFKVAAVSRMGEGPFSAPSLPIQTFPLNWGGTCLAGWVHYKKCRWPQPWWARFWSPKVLPRYAVVDTHAFVWYKNESLALKHRTMKKRKRMKTSFLTRDISLCELSDELHQANELSDEMYAIYVVATARNSHQVRYTIQLEKQEQFDQWVADLGNLVPRHAVGPRLEAYLDAKGMGLPPIDELNAFDEDEKSDGQRSEWSSVTGDESWLNDVEDEELSETRNILGLWYLSFYNCFYMMQDVSMRREEQVYEEDDEMLPSWYELLIVMMNSVRSDSQNVCCLAFICSFIFQGDLLNAFYVFAAFGFLLIENPRPHSHVWHFIMRYSFFVVGARYLFQLPIFCQNINKNSVLYPSMQPFCPEALVYLKNRNPIQPMVYFGLYKFDGIANPSVDTMWSGVAWNFVVILCILFHRRELQLRGMWHHVDAHDHATDDDMHRDTRMTLMSRDSLDVDEFEIANFLARHKEDEAVVKAKPEDFDSRDLGSGPDASRLASKSVAFQDSASVSSGGVGSANYAGSNQGEINSEPEYLQSEEGSNMLGSPTRRTPASVDEAFVEDNEHALSPREALLRAQYARMQQHDATGRDASDVDSPQLSRHTDFDDDEETKVDGVMSPREALLRRAQSSRIQDSPRMMLLKAQSSKHLSRDLSEEVLRANEARPVMDKVDQSPAIIGTKRNGFVVWAERRMPRVVCFFRRLWPQVPQNWDKDISTAIKGSKPGRDYLFGLMAIPFVCIIYAFLFFKYFGEPIQTAETFTINLSDSMLNGYMVLIVFFQLIIMMWDRAAYVCGSVRTKVVLHYIVLIGVHLGLWIMLPLYNSSYFQTRIGLQGFYFLHCIYLWISSNQIKHGYLAFRSNHYSKKPVGDKSWTDVVYAQGFAVYMALPFAFEIRALLDWMCSKTSLNKDMWLLLEETAANLFLVRQEMNSRIDAAPYLKGNKRHPIFLKFITGGLILAVLLTCVVAPLAMFSSLNPSTQPNPIRSTTVVFGLLQQDGTFQQFYTNGDTNSQTYAGLGVKLSDTVTQKNTFESYSKDVWISSPPLRRALVARINSTESLQWTMKLTFTRDGPDGRQTVSSTFNKLLTPVDRSYLLNMLLTQGSTADPARPVVSSSANTATTNSSPAATAPVLTANSSATTVSLMASPDTIAANLIRIPQFYSPVLHVGASSDPTAKVNYALRDLTVARTSEDGVSWWVIMSPDLSSSQAERSGIQIKCKNSKTDKDGFCLVTISDNIVYGLTKLGIGTYGLTAVYIFVIFTVGAFFKEMLRGALFKVLYKELPNPNDLLDLVEGVYIARKEEYMGHLKDEGRLYETLIRMLRSPETLLKITGSNAIHIPIPKDKLD